MGRGGSNIAPKKDHEEKGNYRPSRHDNRSETVVKVVETVPKPPAYMDKRHKDEWTKVCTEVFELGILANPDLYLVEVFVRNWFLFQDAAADVAKRGAVLELKKGPTKNPSVNVMNDAGKVINQIAALFGFSPRARMGIKTEKKKPVDPLDEFGDN